MLEASSKFTVQMSLLGKASRSSGFGSIKSYDSELRVACGTCGTRMRISAMWLFGPNRGMYRLYRVSDMVADE